MVSIFVGVTDKDWFDFLSAAQPDEVNFWAPSGRTNFRALHPGELFLFKLHSPNNFVVGGGVFSNASNLPLSLAWDAFGTKNGVASLDQMRQRIIRYRTDLPIRGVDPIIGCRVLSSPFFWPREQWLPVPASWSNNIVVGRGYDTEESDGASLWNAVVQRSKINLQLTPIGDRERFGEPILVKPRLGQGGFRVLVTDAYERRCAVSGERTLPILDAAHIRSYADGGPHEGSNGLLLRTDIHKLFDLGYVTIDEDRRFIVSRRLREDFDNGKHYYDLHGGGIRAPRDLHSVPSDDALSWHRENRFLG